MTQSKDKSQEKQEYIRYFLFVGLKEILLFKVDLAFLEYNLVILDRAQIVRTTQPHSETTINNLQISYLRTRE